MSAEQPAAVASVYATLGDLRELIEGEPDETLIEVTVRKGHNPDDFYEPVLAEACLSISRGRLCIDVPEPRDVGL